jgi:hypothetical protein
LERTFCWRKQPQYSLLRWEACGKLEFELEIRERSNGCEPFTERWPRRSHCPCSGTCRQVAAVFPRGICKEKRLALDQAVSIVPEDRWPDARLMPNLRVSSAVHSHAMPSTTRVLITHCDSLSLFETETRGGLVE